MKNGLHHLTVRVMAACRNPLSVGAGFAVALVGFVASGVAHEVTMPDDAWLVLAGGTMMSMQVGLLVAAVGAGEGSSGAANSSMFARIYGAGIDAWPNPTLPIHRFIRVVGEALAGLVIVATWQGVLVLVGRGVLDVSWFPTANDAAIIDAMALPLALAWLLPCRAQALHAARAIGAALFGVAMFVAIGAPAGLPSMALISAMSTVALLATANGVARVEGRRRRPGKGASHHSLVRRSHPPLVELWRDACLGPLERGKALLFAGLVTSLAALACRFLGGVPPLAREVLSGIAAQWTGFALIMFPLGVNAFGASVQPGNRRLFDGHSGTEWRVLPLRREWVMRAFYGHGLVAGAAFVGLNLLAVWLSPGAPGFMGMGLEGGPIRWLPYLLMVPSFAGFLVCRAAGDSRLGAVSLTALAWTVPGSLIGLFANLRGSWHGALAFALCCALVGGVPPLCHLFPRRPRSWQRQPGLD